MSLPRMDSLPIFCSFFSGSGDFCPLLSVSTRFYPLLSDRGPVFLFCIAHVSLLARMRRVAHVSWVTRVLVAHTPTSALRPFQKKEEQNKPIDTCHKMDGEVKSRNEKRREERKWEDETKISEVDWKAGVGRETIGKVHGNWENIN